jgi:PKHD-type hydroxylase
VIVILDNLIDAGEVARVREILAKVQWQEGAKTAGWHARLVKANEQAAGPEIEPARRIVTEALSRNEQFRSAALPRNLTAIMFSRYKPGMEYGTHVDDALMPVAGGRIRTDMAVTVFLSDLETYTGGGLSIPGGTETGVRLPPGSAIVYPATSLHRVIPVESGERLAAVFWVQSVVRDEAARETLFDLARARRMIFEKEGKSPAFDLIAKSHANLLRRWAEV